MPPGARAAFAVAGCAGGVEPVVGSGWLSSDAPLTAAVDLAGLADGGDGLMTYVARPWFDRFASWLLARYFFPLSRLWAAARAAEGSPERFYEAVPLAPDP